MTYVNINPAFFAKQKARTKAAEKQLSLKKTLGFLLLDFLRGIATAVFRRKHTK